MNIIRPTPSALAGYRPRTMDDQFGRLVENVFEEMFAPFTQGGALSQWPADGTVSACLTVSESATAFEIQAELPGVNKEDVNKEDDNKEDDNKENDKVAVEHQRITIEGETKREQEQREGENVLYTERSASKFVRSFVLPAEVDEASAEARMENGILTLTLPKKQGGAATRITI